MNYVLKAEYYWFVRRLMWSLWVITLTEDTFWDIDLNTANLLCQKDHIVSKPNDTIISIHIKRLPLCYEIRLNKHFSKFYNHCNLCFFLLFVIQSRNEKGWFDESYRGKLHIVLLCQFHVQFIDIVFQYRFKLKTTNYWSH